MVRSAQRAALTGSGSLRISGFGILFRVRGLGALTGSGASESPSMISS